MDKLTEEERAEAEKVGELAAENFQRSIQYTATALASFLDMGGGETQEPVRIKSCYPEGTTLLEQSQKVAEENLELHEAIVNNNLDGIIEEGLDGVVAKLGLVKLALEQKHKDVDVGITSIMQHLLDNKHNQKQKEFKEAKNNG